MYCVIYDGLCNLCVSLVRILEVLDQGHRFRYVPMQDTAGLGVYGITAQDCEWGMILIDQRQPSRRWQGAAAAEEIGRILPLGALFVGAYRLLPGLKQTGDRCYSFIRDHRYQLFGKRQQTYEPRYRAACEADRCSRYFEG
jgi:predicted DCC family thiol-disulfide oxidoreductase YuxK